MRTSTIIKIIVGFIFLVLMVFFVFENIDPVPIWIPMFKVRQIGLIYIILGAYLIGASNAFWVLTIIANERKRRAKLEEIPEKDQALFEEEEG